MKRRILLFFSLSFFICNIATPQGIFDGFMKKKDNLDAALSFTNEMGSSFVANKKNFNFNRTTRSLSAYLAYGINDKLDIAASLPYISTGDQASLQDMQIGLKYNFFNFNLKNSSRLVFHGTYISSFPVADYKTQDGKSIGQQAVLHSFKMISQFNFCTHYFIQAQGGYNVAISPITNSVPISIKAGWYDNKWYADIWFDYKGAIGGANYPNTLDFRMLGNTTQKIGATGFYRINKYIGFGLNSNYILGGRNTFKGLGVGATFVFKIEK